MAQRDVPSGVVHSLPEDLRAALLRDEHLLALWEGLTPLARNEWICWVEDAKKPETRLKRISRTSEELSQGQRRPCCWPGCPHRVRDGSARPAPKPGE